MFPSLAGELNFDFEQLPSRTYMLMFHRYINLIKAYRGGEFSIYSNDDKVLKDELELKHEIRMGRIKPQKINVKRING